MTDKWISFNEAVAVVAKARSEPDGFARRSLLKAIDDGVSTRAPSTETTEELLRGDLQLYAGGFTAISAEYDERLSGVLRSLSKVNVDELNYWLNRDAGTAGPPKATVDPEKPAMVPDPGPQKPRGMKPQKFDEAKRQMLEDLRSGKLTVETLRDQKGKELERYGLKTTRAKEARTAALSEFVTIRRN